MGNLVNWNAQELERFAEAMLLDLHDEQCEQRERSSLCHCSKRRREAEGFTEPPMIYFQDPVCGHCGGVVGSDGDNWACPRCKVAWPMRAGDGDRGEFLDEYGDDIGGEQFGDRLVDLVRGDA